MFNPNKTDFLLSLINNFLPGRSILIVDDEIEVQRLMANYLIKTKVDDKKIIFANNGTDALNKMLDNKIGLVIVDIIMPEMGGIEFIKELKEIEEFKKIPIIISSGNLNNDVVKDAIIFGVKEILVKPFNYDIFVDRICRVLSV